MENQLLLILFSFILAFSLIIYIDIPYFFNFPLYPIFLCLFFFLSLFLFCSKLLHCLSQKYIFYLLLVLFYSPKKKLCSILSVPPKHWHRVLRHYPSYPFPCLHQPYKQPTCHLFISFNCWELLDLHSCFPLRCPPFPFFQHSQAFLICHPDGECAEQAKK